MGEIEQNVGAVDIVIRTIIGIVLLVIGFKYRTTWAIIGVIFGTILLITAKLGYCSLYTPLKISTIAKKSKKKK